MKYLFSKRFFKILIGLVSCVGLSFAISLVLILKDGFTDSSQTLPEGRTDAAVVLGNGVFQNGQPKRILKARLDRAVELYKLGLFPIIIVSGSDLPGDREIPAMTHYLVQQNIPADAIIEDPNGLDTDATAKDLAKIYQERKLTSVTVISHYYHISRCKLALRHYGIEQIHQAHAGTLSVRTSMSICRDVLAYWAYSIKYLFG